MLWIMHEIMRKQKEYKAAQGSVQIPVLIGSVVPAYNIPGIAKGLKFTGPILADIFQGKIPKWNDPQIKVPTSESGSRIELFHTFVVIFE